MITRSKITTPDRKWQREHEREVGPVAAAELARATTDGCCAICSLTLEADSTVHSVAAEHQTTTQLILKQSIISTIIVIITSCTWDGAAADRLTHYQNLELES